MKTLIDDTEVVDRDWYYILDFNDGDNWNTIRTLFDKTRLCDLELHEFIQLFEIATKQDLENLMNKIK